MEIHGKYIGVDEVERIRNLAASEPSISRSTLSVRLCDWMNWRSPNGNLQEVAGRKVLLELRRRGLIELPERNRSDFFRTRSRRERDAPPDPDEISCPLGELGKIEVVPVQLNSPNQSRVWNEMMEAYHYLGSGPLCGAQIRYLIRSERAGVVGGLSFSAGTKRLKVRDAKIGWSDFARMAHLQRVVCNSRFLIHPRVRVKHLASHALGLALKRLGDDWEQRYAYRPVLVETFVDPLLFKGTCYRAANFEEWGETAGRRGAYPNGKVSSGKKKYFVYPLSANFRDILCEEPVRALCSKPRPKGLSNWAAEEFCTVDLFDFRLKDRLAELAVDFFSQPGAPIPQICGGSKAKTKAAYRFFNNRATDMQVILKGHKESTIDRMKSNARVLAVQDTTTLNYTGHHSTNGLGPIGTKKDPSVGLILHNTMAFTEEGTPLGLLDVQCWARKPCEQTAKRKDAPIEQKESYKWLKSYRAACEAQALCPDTTVISVGDREADIYQLFAEAQRTPGGAKLLVRAAQSRKRKVAGTETEPETFLWDKMSGMKSAGEVLLHIPRRGNRKARSAQLEVRFAEVELKAPQAKDLSPLKLWAVYAKEINRSQTDDAKAGLEWMLLTDVEVPRLQDAVKCLKWYAARWNIEVYHRTLKSGCHIEDRRLHMTDRLETCIALDMIVAWRVLMLTKLGRETPDVPCTAALTEEEWQILWISKMKSPPPATPPPMSWATNMIAKLGGYLGGKSYGPPGATTIWRGLLRFEYIVIGFKQGAAYVKEKNPS